MKRRLPTAQMGVLLLICTALTASGQTAAPPLPPVTQAQKEAAAAIEAPKTFTPPPLPGQLQSNTPAKPAAPMAPPAASAVPTTAPAVPQPSASSASKLQALEAVTQKPSAVEAPHVPAPSDKLPVTTSTSTSRQFVVHGKVFETRSAMSTRCEEIAQDLRKALNDKEPWVLPVVVVLNTGEDAAKAKGPPVSTTISELNFGGFHIQVTINEKPGLNAADLRKEVVRALLAERILRNHQKIEAPQGRMLLPDWIMTGVMLAMEYRSSATPSAMFSTLFRSGKIYGVEEIIEASPTEMDGLSRTIYETSCCALLLALVDQPEGPQHLNKFLNALASDQRSERELLGAAFPSLAVSSSSLNKWWSLQLAALAKPGIGEPFSPSESIKAIEEAITIHYEAVPNAVPKNIKLHPFILPPPLVVASQESPAPPASQPESPGKSATKPEAKDGTAETGEKPKRSLFRRLLFLGDASEKVEGDKAAKTTATTEGKEKQSEEEEKKPGFMSRLFGGGGEEKKSADGAVTKDKTKAAEKPAETAAAPEKSKQTEPEKKTGLMDRLFSSSAEEKKTAEEPTAKPKADDQAKKTAGEEDKKVTAEKPGLMGRLFGSSTEEKKTSDKPAAKDTSAKTSDKPKETADSKDKKTEDDKKPGFMGRLFGAGSDEKKAPAEASATKDKKLSAAEKEKAAAIEKPKTAAKKETAVKEEAKEEKKPTKLNPMNWFRGEKKPSEDKPEEKPAKEKEKNASFSEPATLNVARLISPMLADAWQLLGPAAPRQTVEPLFDFRKRKSKTEEEKKEEPKEDKAPEKKTAPDDKPTAKKSSKPHATNPNAKPAAKPAEADGDKPRTTNPQAKPVTQRQAKASSEAAAATQAEPAPVPVTLPLEEYKHILNHPDKARILSYNVVSLRALELRVSVLFRPVVRAYLAAVMDIEAGKTKDMDKRLAVLHEFALVAYQKSIAVRDYVDWFEASESGRLSGKFEGYLGLPETIKKELPARNDPISKYLDAIDKEFSK